MARHDFARVSDTKKCFKVMATHGTHLFSLSAKMLLKYCLKFDNYKRVIIRTFLPVLNVFLIWAFPGLFIFPFSWYIVSLQLIIFTLVNDDRKHERRRKSMHLSITRY